MIDFSKLFTAIAAEAATLEGICDLQFFAQRVRLQSDREIELENERDGDANEIKPRTFSAMLFFSLVLDLALFLFALFLNLRK